MRVRVVYVMWCAVSKLIHTLLSLVALQAHDICNRLACLGLFPSFIFSPFFFGWGVTSPCAHMWQPQLVPFIVIPFMRRPHLATLRAFQAVLILFLTAACCCCSGFPLFYCLLLFYYYRNSTLLARPLSLFAPLFMPRCGRHYFSSASCKLNKTHTHTQAHSHVHTKLADELTDN